MILSKPALLEWLTGRVEDRSPAAIVRFGDGEADLIDARPDDSESMATASRKLESQAGAGLAHDAVTTVGLAVEEAFEEADVLGILVGYRFSEDKANSLTRRYLQRLRSGGKRVALTNCLFHHDLLESLPTVMAGRRVSVISCRDVKPALEREWGARDVVVYQVPSPRNARDVDGRYEATMHDVSIWPDAHDRVQDELDIRERGEIVLVGAGIVGKDLCIRIREKGGLALDLGSALDRLAGKITRGAMRRIFLLHGQGWSAVKIADHLEGKYGVAVDPQKVKTLIDDPAPHATDNPHMPRLFLG